MWVALGTPYTGSGRTAGPKPAGADDQKRLPRPQGLSHQRAPRRIPALRSLPAQCNGSLEVDSIDLWKIKASDVFTQVHELLPPITRGLYFRRSQRLEMVSPRRTEL